MAAKKIKTVLVLRSVDKDGKAYNGFQWPKKGKVEAPDFDPEPRCGNGLHGWLRGEGDAESGGYVWGGEDFETRLWQVVEVNEKDIIQLGGKVKFPRGAVVFTGSRLEATEKIQAAYPDASVIGGVVTAGVRGTATAGDSGTATAGDSGTATAGYAGTATAGYAGTATAGDSGTATAGVRGTVVLKYWDSVKERYRVAVGYVGEDGIEANKKYCLNADGKFVEVKA